MSVGACGKQAELSQQALDGRLVVTIAAASCSTAARSTPATSTSRALSPGPKPAALHAGVPRPNTEASRTLSALGPHCLVPPATQSFAHVPTRIVPSSSALTGRRTQRSSRRRATCADFRASHAATRLHLRCRGRALALRLAQPPARTFSSAFTVANPARRDASRQSGSPGRIWHDATADHVVGARLLTPAQRSTLVAEAEA